ncbi:putative kinetochore subunit nkp2 [Diplodia seriata]|uniref:Putative kinetochore subunit nkp2 n=1 Tax=Diplodia seriata TaxID=420778 RepID=A0A0G2HK93_9PEZI|nr:putative kinetochore subunit nkp2 [Diplodia seriata]
MAPNESSILSNFLLPPAPLQTIITLRQFTDLFPRTHQSNPAIPKLYRELQHQRAIDTDDVKRNIAAECKRGERQAREVARARRRDEAADSASAGLTRKEEMDVKLEEDLHGRAGATAQMGAGRSKKRTAVAVAEDMEQAERDLEEEIAGIEEETEAVLEDLRNTVGDLSDLRYGRFNKPAAGGEEPGQETVTTLRQLQEVCQDIGNG